MAMAITPKTTSPRVVCLWVLLLFELGLAAAQVQYISEPQGPGARCVHVDNVTAELGVCKNYITYEYIYSDDHMSSRFDVLKLFVQTQGVVAEPCLSTSFRKICAGLFRECLAFPSSPADQVAVVGRYPCRSLCKDSEVACIEVLSKLLIGVGLTAETVLDCDVPWSVMWGTPSHDIFPEGNYTVEVSPNVLESHDLVNVTIPCYDGNRNLTVEPQVECPDGLHPTGEPGACAFDCPQPVITDNEYQAVEIMMSVMAWISLAATALVIGSYILVAGKRKFPANLPLFFVVAVGGRTLAFCVGSMVGHEEVWCDGDKHFNSFGDAACTIQGILFVYFTWAGALWWLTITLNLFFTIVLSWKLNRYCILPLLSPRLATANVEEDGRAKRRKSGGVSLVEVVFQALCWGLPCIPLIIALSGQQLGYAGASFWCTIHSGDGEVIFQGSSEGTTHSGSEEHNLWNLMLLTVPILVLVFIGVVLLIVTAIVGYKKSREGWQFLLRQWRLFAFLLLYVWIYTFVFSFQIHFNYVQEAQYKAYNDYIDCLYTHSVRDFVSSLAEGIEECSLRQEVNFGLWFVVTFNEVSQGLFVFLIFGTSAGVFQAWRSALWHCRWRAASESSSSGGTPSSAQTKEVMVVVEGVTMKDFTEDGGTREAEASEAEDEEAYSEDEEEANVDNM
ncbi:Frizzled [Balamuthia mandrillaris]